ncbi:phage tail tape measure protein [Rhodopseudomonas sp. BR0C11]|uniref:phage tail tape measure protein n=1 Tax=Rhodopseudomonas sp. BR0C11 TaxID=2269370 RepID=UPI0013DF6DF0|nr:phage tail tape measure protein [Rhodopseudomonas sp. BR0C11]NEV76993.1 phage tail tape measure protein [Rhodopseudomonas sp. BR0C11]
MTGSGTGETCDCACVDDTTQKVDQLTTKTQALSSEAKGFARAMTSAFSQAVTGGKQFEDVLKSLALKVSDLALKAALKPLTTSLATGLASRFPGLFGGSPLKNANSNGGATTVNIRIATPDADSFRRSETYLTGQIARAVARGQRGL